MGDAIKIGVPVINSKTGFVETPEQQQRTNDALAKATASIIDAIPPPVADKPKRARKVADPEIQAMAQIDAILSGLGDDDAACRIMCWLWDRHMHTDPPGSVKA